MATKIDNLYVPSTIKIVESLKPSEIPKQRSEVDSILLNKVMSKYGNKCIHSGFIQKDSIEILERSIGSINSAHFNGEVYYNIKAQVRICSPNIGSHVSCKIIGKNQAGIFCVAFPLQVMLSPENHEDIEIFDNLVKGDNIIIEVVRQQILLNHDHIKILGKFIKKE